MIRLVANYFLRRSLLIIEIIKNGTKVRENASVRASFQEELENGTENTKKRKVKIRNYIGNDFIDTKSNQPLMIGGINDEQKLLVT